MFQLAMTARAPVAALGAALLILVSASGAQAESLELRTGVVVDPDAARVYLMSPSGGIDAVSLDTGNVAWRSTAAARPIAASGSGLLAQVERSAPGNLEIAWLDGSGRAVQSAVVELPEGVAAPVAASLSHSFLITARQVRSATAGDSGPGPSFAVDWQSFYQPPRGAPVRREEVLVEAALAERAQETSGNRSGGFAFDVATGVVSAATMAAAGAGTEGVALATRNVHVPQARRLPVTGNQYLSADGTHRMVSTVAPLPTGEIYEWSVYADNGSRLGSLRQREPYGPFFIRGGLIYFVSPSGSYRKGDEIVEKPLMLHAVLLANGVEQWSHAIRDAAYRGPFPP